MVDSLKWAHMPSVRDDVKPLTIVHLFPELLNLYGDGGNVIALTRRLQWRSLPVEVREIGMGDAMDFSQADIVFIGGGADREQMIVKDAMVARKSELSAYVADGGVLLAVCGGYQFLGHSYAMDDVVVEGLGVIDMETVRGEGRLIGNAVIQSDICDAPIVGFENRYRVHRRWRRSRANDRERRHGRAQKRTFRLCGRWWRAARGVRRLPILGP